LWWGATVRFVCKKQRFQRIQRRHNVDGCRGNGRQSP